VVFRVFRPEGGRQRSHASQGRERRLAVLFLDMRGFTSRTAGQLPYDVLFLLNRFFDAIVPPILRAGGTVDKYLGDGLLAVFDLSDAKASAQAALRAADWIGTALEAFNQNLALEGGERVRIGIGLHLGNLVLGEIGAAGHAPRTIIGDTVNVASRLEAATKDHGVGLLVSGDLLHAAGVDPDRFEMVTLTLRGVAGPVVALPLADPRDLGAIVADLDRR
jgi:adenylate cyclase